LVDALGRCWAGSSRSRASAVGYGLGSIAGGVVGSGVVAWIPVTPPLLYSTVEIDCEW